MPGNPRRPPGGLRDDILPPPARRYADVKPHLSAIQSTQPARKYSIMPAASTKHQAGDATNRTTPILSASRHPPLARSELLQDP